jgi:hypothetical protein
LNRNRERSLADLTSDETVICREQADLVATQDQWRQA